MSKKVLKSDEQYIQCAQCRLYARLKPCSHRRTRRGVVASVVRRMNEITLRRARLVLGWVTVFGRVYHHGM